MLSGIFDQKLECTGNNHLIVRAPIYLHCNLHAFGKSLLEKVDIHIGKFELLAKLHKGLLLVVEHISVCRRHLANKGTCTLGLLLLHKVVEDGEAVEEEVGVELSFELGVLVLCALALCQNL